MRNPNAMTLATRDRALASLLGAIDGDDFGSDVHDDFGDEHGFGFGSDPIGDDYHADPIGADNGKGHGGPSHAQLMRLYNEMRARHYHTRRRHMLLDPNADSTLKIEGYSFDIINESVTLTTSPSVAGVSITMTQTPDTEIKPTRLMNNSLSAGFILLSVIKIANVSVLVGDQTDAVFYQNVTVGQKMSLPKLNQSTRCTVLGEFTGFVPAGFSGVPYNFIMSLQGPATVAGEGTR